MGKEEMSRGREEKGDHREVTDHGWGDKVRVHNAFIAIIYINPGTGAKKYMVMKIK